MSFQIALLCLLLYSQAPYYILLLKCGGSWWGSLQCHNIALFLFSFCSNSSADSTISLLDPLDLCLLCLSLFSLHHCRVGSFIKILVHYRPSCYSNCTVTVTICVFLCALSNLIQWPIVWLLAYHLRSITST